MWWGESGEGEVPTPSPSYIRLRSGGRLYWQAEREEDDLGERGGWGE